MAKSRVKGKTLAIASCQFPTGSDIRKNAQHVRRQMKLAQKRGAEVAHFPETCLSGYGGTDVMSWDGFDWDLLQEESRSIAKLAKELKLWVVLGSSHQLSGKHNPHNSLYVISAAGRVQTRYDKRMCTGVDLEYYTAGNHPSVFTINGVKCAAIICYEVRFPELYRQYQQMGVQVMFHSFYNAAHDGDTIHTIIMRPSLQFHAASNYMWISATNVSTPHQLWPSVFIQPNGEIKRSLKQNANALMVNTVDTSVKMYDASGPYRDACIAGQYSNGPDVEDDRSSNLKSW